MKCFHCCKVNIQEATRCQYCGRIIIHQANNSDTSSFENTSSSTESNQAESQSLWALLKRINFWKVKISIIILVLLPPLSLGVLILSKYYFKPRFEAEKVSQQYRISFAPQSNKVQQNYPKIDLKDPIQKQLPTLTGQMRAKLIQVVHYYHRYGKFPDANKTLKPEYQNISISNHGNVVGRIIGSNESLLIYDPSITEDGYLVWQCIAVNLVANEYLQGCIFSDLKPVDVD